MSLRSGLLALVGMVLVSVSWAAPERVADGVWRDAEVPEWVRIAPLEGLDEADGDGQGNQKFLLYDDQDHAGLSESFYRRAYQVTTADGVEQLSNLRTSFDPSYQQLTWHILRLWREGKIIDLLPEQQFMVSVKEGARDYLTYEKSIDVEVLLNRVRPGDVIDYAYRISGENPLTPGKFSEWYWLTNSIDMGSIQHAVIWPADREAPQIKHLGLPEPTVEIKQEILPTGETRYFWRLDEPELINYDDDIPYNYDADAWVQVSNWPDWPAVSRWAGDLIDWEAPLPEELLERIETWQALPNDEAKVAAVLNWVQTSIRYVAVPMGEHTYRPYPLSTILDRGFGDCKDKSQLFTRILLAMGLDAVPVLVNTDSRALIRNNLPTPGSFDHVITRVRLGKQVYWLDPTASPHFGPLKAAWVPNYGWGLPIQGGSDLVPVPGQGGDFWTTQVHESFRLIDADSPIEMTVLSRYQGQAAVDSISYFRGRKLQQVSDDYTNFYATDYEGIEAAEMPRAEEEREQGFFTVHESYRINEGFETSDDGVYAVLHTYPRILGEYLFVSQQRLRTSPMALSYPLNVEHRITIDLDAGGTFESEDEEIVTPWFEFRYQARPTAQGVDILYTYRNLRDRVEVAEMAEYRKRIDEVEDLLGYGVQIPKDTDAYLGDDADLDAVLAELGWTRDGVLKVMIGVLVAIGLAFAALIGGIVWLVNRK